jgi:RNA polymerase sigma-70 factor, ECF subfamily
MAAPVDPQQVPDTPRAPDHGARDRILLERIREGDLDAFDALFCAYRDDLGAFVHSIVRVRESAEEIIHDLFLRLWEGRDLWEFEGVVRAYLFRAARNRAISYLRHQRAELRLREQLSRRMADRPPAPVEPPADAMAEARDLEAAIARAVERLPRRCQEVFRLSRHHQLSHGEVAKVMGISPRTVEVQLRRALIALRAELERLA